MKLTDLVPNNPVSELKLVHPAGVPINVSIFCTAKDTGDAKSLAMAIADRRIREQIRSTSKKGWSTEEQEKDQHEVLSKCIQSWTGLFEDDDTTPLPCTPENKKALLATPWIFKQIDAFVSEDANFFKI